MATPIVTLPSCPVPNAATYSLVSYSTEMTGPLGGPTQRVLRLGSRFKLDLEFGPMRYGDGRQWLARLLAGEAAPCAIPFPQRGFIPLYPGPVVVNGPQTSTVNTGGVLAVHGGIAGVELVSGQFFHIASATTGRRYIHQVRDDVTIGQDGTATLAIQPPLRFIPTDGDVLEFVTPVIEGFVATGWSWTIEMVRRVGLKFSITEDR